MVSYRWLIADKFHPQSWLEWLCRIRQHLGTVDVQFLISNRSENLPEVIMVVDVLDLEDSVHNWCAKRWMKVSGYLSDVACSLLHICLGVE